MDSTRHQRNVKGYGISKGDKITVLFGFLDYGNSLKFPFLMKV